VEKYVLKILNPAKAPRREEKTKDNEKRERKNGVVKGVDILDRIGLTPAQQLCRGRLKIMSGKKGCVWGGKAVKIFGCTEGKLL
jgi:hypothetical protein